MMSQMPLHIEGVLVHQQLGEVLLDDIPGAGSASSISLNSLVRFYLDRPAAELARSG